MFDTGSTNTWILNKNTKANGGKKIDGSFDDSKSRTFKMITPRKEHKVHFGSGSLRGNFATDTVTLGPCESGITIPHMNIGNVIVQKNLFEGDNFEGIVGLAYPKLGI